MTVSENGEIGRLVKFYPSSNEVILWAVTKATGNVYMTSLGNQVAPAEAYFCPTSRERSLKPCILRALAYVKQKWPNAKSCTTH